MKNFIVLIIVSIYSINCYDNFFLDPKIFKYNGARKSAPGPPKNFTIDQNAMVYYFGSTDKYWAPMRMINASTNVKYFKFNNYEVGDEVIDPYTIFLKTIVVVEYNLYKSYAQILDRVMSYLAFTEFQANRNYQYPKFKIIATAIVILTDEHALEILKPHPGNYLDSTPQWFVQIENWLKELNNNWAHGGMDYDFSCFITSADATAVYSAGTRYLIQGTSEGFVKCGAEDKSKMMPIIVVPDNLPRDDYKPVYVEFVTRVSLNQWNYVCKENYVNISQKLSPSTDYPACTLSNLREEFLNDAWPPCVYQKPQFLH